ncbi:MAG TPA: cation:proton antiporter [Candidatus Thermoplasmatota archaeon]|nr:cation:proton antiporter [Candidatus Thermoplasmatota archaeon]
MITVYDLALLIALALICARVFGYIFTKIKLPSVIGEILAGVFLGAVSLTIFNGQTLSLFGFSWSVPELSYLSVEFDFLAEIGILFLMFISGLSTSINQLKSMGKTSTMVALGGVIVPLGMGFSTGILFGFGYQESLIIGLILVATSVGVTVRTLMDIHKLDTDAGSAILGGAVIDDVLGILLLAFVVGSDPFLYVGFKIVLFFILFVYFGLKIIDKILGLGEYIHLPKAFLSISLSLFLLFSFFADRFGVSGIIGAFIAGLLIGQSIKSRKIVDDVQTLGYGFFVPLFFIWIGAKLIIGIVDDFASFTSIAFFAFIIILVAIVGKIIGCGIGARLSGSSFKESVQIGIGMIPRMELALIIISTAISKELIVGIVANQLLAISVLITVCTTLITPILINITFKDVPSKS